MPKGSTDVFHGLIVLLLGLISTASYGQQTYSITGLVTDENDLPAIGADCFLEETNFKKRTDLDGSFTLNNIPTGSYKLICTYLGYTNDTLTVELDQSIDVQVVLKINVTQLDEVILLPYRLSERSSVSNLNYKLANLRTSHGLTEDPIRALTSLPGVASEGDLFSPAQIYVRGGDSNENLFLVDNAKLFFPFYFGGQKSLLNTEIINRIKFQTGGFSAAYGNHLSSVIDVKTKEGDLDEFGGQFTVGFYNASALIEGPIQKHNSSFLIAARRTYLDLFLKENASFPVPSLGDIQYKFTQYLTHRHRITLSGLSSTESIDYLVENPKPGIPDRLKTKGTNHLQSVQIKSQLLRKTFNTLAVSNAFNKNNTAIGQRLFLAIQAQQIGFRNDFIHNFSYKHKLKAGIEWQYSNFNFEGRFPLDPYQTDPTDTTIVLQNRKINQKGETQRSGYLLFDGNLVKKLAVNAGVRFDNNPKSKYTDIAPRLIINYQILPKIRLKGASGIYYQFPGVGISDSLRSNRAIHYILGLEFFDSYLSGWIEAYYKDYSNLVHQDANLNYSNSGRGSAKGIEFFLQRTHREITGKLSYSLSHSRRTIPLGTEIKDFGYDQRHILNIIGEYRVKKWRESDKWFLPSLFHINLRFTDGMPYTPVVYASPTATGWLPIQGDYFSKRNSDYFNFNLRIEWSFQMGKKGVNGTSFIEVWNLFDNKNLLGRSYQYGAEYPNNVNETPYFSNPRLMAGGVRFNFGSTSYRN